MSVAVLVLRLGLAVVFAVAAAGKLARPAATAESLADFGAPRRLRRPGAFALPAAELAVAVLLVPGPTARWGAVAALALLLGFSVAVGRSLRRGERPDCNCFGAVGSAPVGPRTLLRNAGLGAVAAIVLVAGPGAALASIDGATALAFLGGAVLLGLAFLGWQLFEQNGRLLQRVRALEELTGVDRHEPPPPPPNGLAVGTPAPDLLLTGADGSRRSLLAPIARGRSLALVFSNPGCPSCERLAARLPALRAELDPDIDLRVVVRGAEAPAGLAEAGIELLFQDGSEALAAYAIGALPSAVVVGADGRAASPTAVGDAAIAALLRNRHDPGMAVGLSLIGVGG
ncbi:MAG TPA: MauE/DoxX family redox-associated membrane protein [Solirubrobacterales bacterium]|nr:MauE/DoxX family redox-associated membrane protein [Solirubrobacterales bacterium]